MYDEPKDISTADLMTALQRSWAIEIADIEYEPVGFGSYHWRVTDAAGSRWFVTADRLDKLSGGTDEVFERLRAAYETASALKDQGNHFVVAPSKDANGGLIQHVSADWGVAVFEWIDGARAGDGPWPKGSRRSDAADLVGKLHAAEPPAELQRFSFEIDFRSEIFDVVSGLVGPYAERAQSVLTGSRYSIEALFARYDALVARLEGDDAAWVVTHGEPHSANFITGVDGQLHLIDWDTVRLAPPERDLAALPMAEPEVLAAYLNGGWNTELRPHATKLFEAWWVLTEISLYARDFRQPHTDSEDSRVSWRGLQENVAAAVTWRSRH